ncbi:MAG: aquaporin Z [Bacteroidales bacterium]|jgi:aquaporin Z|nr:aquaporin Z [Bacteroidales bacterium]
MKKNLSEFLGTFWLVLGGCGTAVLASSYVGILGIALAFGLTVLTMAYAVGHISGGHFNPAVTFGLWAGGKFNGKDILPYVCSQVLGAIAAAAVLFLILKSGDKSIDGFAANGYGEHSPGGFGIVAALVTEFVMTFFFLIIILGATDKNANGKFAGIAIGLALTLIHLISIPVTNTSVNPARSISQAIFAEGNWALGQVWLFIIVPIVGAMCAGWVYKCLKSE